MANNNKTPLKLDGKIKAIKILLTYTKTVKPVKTLVKNRQATINNLKDLKAIILNGKSGEVNLLQWECPMCHGYPSEGHCPRALRIWDCCSDR